SHRKALSAMRECRFKAQIVPVELPAKKKGQESVIFDKDESPREEATAESLAALKPVFKKDGTVTAGNAPGMNDGAAALIVTSARRAQELGAKPMVRIVAQATSGVEPQWVMMAPVSGVRKLWQKTGRKAEDVDLYELSEAKDPTPSAPRRRVPLSGHVGREFRNSALPQFPQLMEGNTPHAPSSTLLRFRNSVLPNGRLSLPQPLVPQLHRARDDAARAQ